MEYLPFRKYGDKDKLPSGDPGKVIYGDELDDEFQAISDALYQQSLEIGKPSEDLEKGGDDGETLCWHNGQNKWVSNETLKVQPADNEVVAEADVVVKPMRVEQGTGNELGYLHGNHGFKYKARRFDNANDPWSGATGTTWEIASIEPRDANNETARRNGIDMTCDRFTMRVTADWSQTNWWETQIVFRADGEEVEIGARNNTTSVFTNGDVYVGHQPDNRPDNNDVADGTLFVKQGIIVGRGNTGGASIGMEGNIIWNLGDPENDTCAVNLGYLKSYFEGIEIDTNVSNGEEDGETISWNASAGQWQKNDLLKVQPGDKEIILDGLAVSQPALINQGTGQNLGQVEGNHGFVYRSRRFENANDPWSGTTGATWEIASIEPRDGGNEPARQNGIDLTADRVTMRVTADWSATDWYETQIVFRADGEELELGSRDNPQTVKVNGNLTCSNSTELGDSNDDQHVFHGDVYVGYVNPDNVPDTDLGDATPGTLFLSRGVKLVQDPASTDGHIPSFNAGGFKVVNLAPGVYDGDSVNFKQFNDLIEAQKESNQNVYEYLVRMEMILEAADTFEAYKRNMLANLRSTIQTMEP